VNSLRSSVSFWMHASEPLVIDALLSTVKEMWSDPLAMEMRQMTWKVLNYDWASFFTGRRCLCTKSLYLLAFVGSLCDFIRVWRHRREAFLWPGEASAPAVIAPAVLYFAGVCTFEQSLRFQWLLGEQVAELESKQDYATILVMGMTTGRLEQLCEQAEQACSGPCLISQEIGHLIHTCSGTMHALHTLRKWIMVFLKMDIDAGFAVCTEPYRGGEYGPLLAPIQNQIGEALASFEPAIMPSRCKMCLGGRWINPDISAERLLAQVTASFGTLVSTRKVLALDSSEVMLCGYGPADRSVIKYLLGKAVRLGKLRVSWAYELPGL